MGAAAGLAAVGAAAAYLGLVTGAVPVDLGVGRRTRPLGPLTMTLAAPRETVYAVLVAPYRPRPSRAMREHVVVLERSDGLLLAAHHKPILGRLSATTVETVRLTPPERVDFRLVRGPVPHVVESFVLADVDGTTVLTYRGELGTDLWAVGEQWGARVAGRWERAVRTSLEEVRTEAERRAR